MNKLKKHQYAGQKNAPQHIEGQVPVKFAQTLLRLVAESNYDLKAVLESAGLELSILKASDNNYVSVAQYSSLCKSVMNLLHDGSFGLQAGKGVTPGAFRMLCYAIIHCKNLGSALQRACDFFRIFYTEALHLSLHVEEDLAYLGYERASVALSVGVSQVRDASGLCAWHRFSSWLISEVLHLRCVDFVNAKPKLKTQKRFQDLFAAPVSYNKPSSLLVFDKKYLSYPILQTEETLKEFLASAPHYLLVMPSKDLGRGNLLAKVKSLIGRDFSQRFPSFEEISTALNMSGPTLRRHLKKEGVTFQQIKDDSRKEASIAYLSRPELSINTVAALMGFTEPSAFHRSFKKWTGKPPGQFRQELLLDPDAWLQ